MMVMVARAEQEQRQQRGGGGGGTRCHHHSQAVRLPSRESGGTALRALALGACDLADDVGGAAAPRRLPLSSPPRGSIAAWVREQDCRRRARVESFPAPAPPAKPASPESAARSSRAESPRRSCSWLWGAWVGLTARRNPHGSAARRERHLGSAGHKRDRRRARNDDGSNGATRLVWPVRGATRLRGHEHSEQRQRSGQRGGNRRSREGAHRPGARLLLPAPYLRHLALDGCLASTGPSCVASSSVPRAARPRACRLESWRPTNPPMEARSRQAAMVWGGEGGHDPAKMVAAARPTRPTDA